MGGTGRMGNEELEVAALAVWGPKWSAVGPHAPPHQGLVAGTCIFRDGCSFVCVRKYAKAFSLVNIH
jgi:hypothetical protein